MVRDFSGIHQLASKEPASWPVRIASWIAALFITALICGTLASVGPYLFLAQDEHALRDESRNSPSWQRADERREQLENDTFRWFYIRGVLGAAGGILFGLGVIIRTQVRRQARGQD
jgi:hypothetical protein